MAGSKIRLYGSTSGYVELEAPAVGDDGVLSLPTAADGFGAAGIGSNIVQTVKTDTFSASVAQGAVSAAAISASITPTSATSKILVLAALSVGGYSLNVNATLYRDSSVLVGAQGDAAGSRHRITGSANNNNLFTDSLGVSYVDSPATTSAVTYDFRLSHDVALTRTVYLNRGDGDSNTNATGRPISSITLIEVAV